MALCFMTKAMSILSGNSLPGVQRNQLRALLRRLGYGAADRRLPGAGGRPAARHPVLDADDCRQRLRTADAARRQRRVVHRAATRQTGRRT